MTPVLLAESLESRIRRVRRSGVESRRISRVTSGRDVIEFVDDKGADQPVYPRSPSIGCTLTPAAVRN